MYLLLSLCTSRASCKCLLMCQTGCQEVLEKRLFPSILLEALPCRNSLNVTDLNNNSITAELLSIHPRINPLEVAAGSCNIDFLQAFLKENDRELSLDETEDVLLCLTEPFPDQKLASLTKTIMERSDYLTVALDVHFL